MVVEGHHQAVEQRAEVPFPDDRIYYEHAGSIGANRRISWQARRAVYRLFLEKIRPTAETSVLDLGVSLDVTSIESNTFEQFYPHRGQLVCAGIGEGLAVTKAYPGIRFVPIMPHQRLPFADAEFDVGYSNAVVEHAGSREAQCAFVSELCRVAKRVFVVVPNRLFPVEHHTGIPLVHYLPLTWFRALLRQTRLRHWAEESNLNPLFIDEFRSLFPAAKAVEIQYAGLGLSIFRSNLVAISSR